MKTLKAAALLTALALALSGCTFDTSLDALLSTPKLTQEQTAVYDALIQSTGSQVELAYPRSGGYRSAFVLYDLDSDGSEEAIVFYRGVGSSQEESILRMNFLDNGENGWSSVLDKPLVGTSVEFVEFDDFGYGTDIVISCSALNQTEQAAIVLNYSDDGVYELYRSNYVHLETVDFDSDGVSQLFLISYDAALGYHTAYLLGSSEEIRFDVLGSVPLNSDAAGFLRLSSQRLGEDDILLFLDYSKGDNAYGTQLIRCLSSNLTQVKSDGMSRRSNAHTPILYSSDIDGDGRIEIPVTAALPGYESLTIPEQVFSVEWYYADENLLLNLTKKYTAYISPGGEYMFYIPVRWQGLVTVEKNGSVASFVKYGSGEPLLSVCVPSDGASPGGNWERYGDSDTAVYINTYGGTDDMALTSDELSGCLVIL